jgi:hypothetical protein
MLARISLATAVAMLTSAAALAQEPSAFGFASRASFLELSDIATNETTGPATSGTSFPAAASPCYWNFDPRPLWEVYAGAVVLTRAAPHRSRVIEDAATGNTLLNANSYDFNWSAGADIFALRRVDGDHIDAYDVRYFGLQSLAAPSSVTTAGAWRLPNDADTSAAATIDTVFRSQLYSAEFNGRHYSTPALAFLAGMRWLQLNDQIIGNADAGTITEFRESTQNNLYGAQVGFVWSRPPEANPFSLVWTSKVGIFGNAARNHLNANCGCLSNDSQGQLAFVGDVNLVGKYALGDHISLQGGYQLLWIGGVAVASDQFVVMQPSTTHDGINSRGGVFFHGAMASLNVNW